MAKLGRLLGILANCVLLLGAALCAGLFAFLVWRHGMSLRYLVFVGLAVILALGVRMPESLRINSVLVGVSTCVAVYLAELLLAYSGTAITSLGGSSVAKLPSGRKRTGCG
jgi:hypothetical protein